MAIKAQVRTILKCLKGLNEIEYFIEKKIKLLL